MCLFHAWPIYHSTLINITCPPHVFYLAGYIYHQIQAWHIINRLFCFFVMLKKMDRELKKLLMHSSDI